VFWLGIISFKSNFKKHLLGMVALAMAVVVSSLGLSAVDLMMVLARYPITQVIGGDFMICNEEVEFLAGRGGVYVVGGWMRPVDYAMAKQAITSVLPHAYITGSLVVPVVVPYDERQVLRRMVLGRAGGFGSWDTLPTMVSGEALSLDNYNRHVVLTSVPDSRRLNVANNTLSLHVATLGEDGVWQLAGTDRSTLSVLGTFGHPSPDGYLWSHLPVVQELAGADGKVSWLGVRVPGMLTDDVKREITAKLSALPGITAYSSEALSDLFVADFARLRTAANYYVPLIILISCQIIIATSLALVVSRRRELALLRAIGVSFRDAWSLFVIECTAVSVIACGIGTAVAGVVAQSLFGATSVSFLPFVFSVLITVVLAALLGRVVLPKGAGQLLRNG